MNVVNIQDFTQTQEKKNFILHQVQAFPYILKRRKGGIRQLLETKLL